MGTKNLGKKLFDYFVYSYFAAVFALGVMGTSRMINGIYSNLTADKKIEIQCMKQREGLYAFTDRIYGFDTNNDGNLDKIERYSVALGPRRTAVPTKQSYTPDDKEFKRLETLLEN